jgi:chromosome segregation ATPase
MPFADRKTWENTRPSDIKDTGIGAACDLWKKSCTAQLKDIADDKDKTSGAFVAIDKMLGALKNATGKVSKVKDANKKTAVEELLKEWKKKTEDFQKALSALVMKSVDSELINKKLLDAAKVANQQCLALAKEIDGPEQKMAAIEKRLNDLHEVLQKAFETLGEVEVDGKKKSGAELARLIQENKVEPTDKQTTAMKFMAPISTKIIDLQQESFDLEREVMDLRKRIRQAKQREEDATKAIDQYATQKAKNEAEMSSEDYKEWQAIYRNLAESLKK